MRKSVAITAVFLLLFSFVAPATSASTCEPLRKTGSTGENIDLLLVGGEDYQETSSMEKDFQYYIGTEERGLFDVYPMNVTVDRFNVWYVQGREGSSTTSGDRGPFREARYWSQNCEDIDYSVFMSRTNHDWGGGALDDVARVDGVEDKVDEGNGAVGLIHEWGHLFGDVADEYNYESGKRLSTKPNCARNRSQAEKWWGEMAELTDQVGYEKGCKGSENIEAHPGKSIMGDGGLWHYGPVNDRNFLKKITEESDPVTDIAIDSYEVSGDEISLDVSWEKASNVVHLEAGQNSKQIFAYGSGSRTVKLQRPESDDFKIELETETEIEEISMDNNVRTFATTPEISVENPEEGAQASLTPLLSVEYNDPNGDSGEATFLTEDGEVIGGCEIENGEVCEVEHSDAQSYDTVYRWYVKATDSAGHSSSTEVFEFRTLRPEITESLPSAEKDGIVRQDSVQLEVYVEDGPEGQIEFYGDGALLGTRDISGKSSVSLEWEDLVEGRHKWHAELADQPEIETSENEFEVYLNSEPLKPVDLEPDRRDIVDEEPELSARFIDPDDETGTLVFMQENGAVIESCEAENNTKCSVEYDSADEPGEYYNWVVKARDTASETSSSHESSFLISNRKTDTASNPSDAKETGNSQDKLEYSSRTETANSDSLLPVAIAASALILILVLVTSVKFE